MQPIIPTESHLICYMFPGIYSPLLSCPTMLIFKISHDFLFFLLILVSFIQVWQK